MTKLEHIVTGEIEDFPELIDLQSAHVTQHTSNGVKTEWTVRKNITKESLHKFPSRLNEVEMFSILNFAKKYELIAFNEGINFQKSKQNAFLQATIKELQINNKNLADENIRLAGILENLLPEEV